jgi:hypothetical protein
MALPNNQQGSVNGVTQYRRSTLYQTAAEFASTPSWLVCNDETDTFGYYSSHGSPEGVVTANIGSYCVDTTNGNLYIKGTDSVNTGWSIVPKSSNVVNHAVQVGNASGGLTSIAVGTTGQLLVGSTGADPAFGSSANANFTFTSSTAGSTRTFTVSNTDNTNTASNALIQTTVGGASGGDPFHTYTVTGGASWSTGIDNSASDTYVIAASTSLGTTNVMSMSTSGLVNVVLDNFRTIRSNPGGVVNIEINNTSNTANSDALLLATVAGTSSGDAYSRYIVTGGDAWTVGVDNSDSDAFVVSNSTAPGTNNLIRGDSVGGQYRGHSDNTAPAAGFIGEQIRSFVGSGSAVAVATNTPTNVTSISLTPGIWDVSCVGVFSAAAITGSNCAISISGTSATRGTNGDSEIVTPTVPTASSAVGLSVPSLRVTLNATTTYYLIAYTLYTVGSQTAFGRISATRVA